jgi:glycosyltransferase involved in cell wall biosynthesis
MDSWVNDGIIEFCGRADDVRPFLTNTHVYCLPSYYREGLPRSVLEAMAIGRPVITTDAPGCRELVRKPDNGFLVPVKNVDAVANSMISFCKQPSLISEMGQNSRLTAEQRFDVHTINRMILNILGID